MSAFQRAEMMPTRTSEPLSDVGKEMPSLKGDTASLSSTRGFGVSGSPSSDSSPSSSPSSSDSRARLATGARTRAARGADHAERRRRDGEAAAAAGPPTQARPAAARATPTALPPRKAQALERKKQSPTLTSSPALFIVASTAERKEEVLFSAGCAGGTAGPLFLSA